jgi:nucleoside 2-deoxyribosyltransferase
MGNPIEKNATKIIVSLFENNPHEDLLFDGDEISHWTGLNSVEINNAIDFLDDRGLLDRRNYLGTAPYNFGVVGLNSRGNYIYHELKEANEDKSEVTNNSIVAQQPLAAGSPFGFTDIDWEFVQTELSKNSTIKIVFGYQFKSQHYNSENLKLNLQNQFQTAIDKINAKQMTKGVSLNFKSLAAGYGEHLFNQIARDIISADIAVFETSDMNSNVMIEMGVALTWGKRVLPIKKEGQPTPPSDISGQTYADYINDADNFVSTEHDKQILSMVERAIMKKRKN